MMSTTACRAALDADHRGALVRQAATPLDGTASLEVMSFGARLSQPSRDTPKRSPLFPITQIAPCGEYVGVES